VEPGLTDHELAAVEAKFGFEFADDRRAFLAVALPVWAAGHDDDPDKVSWGWPQLARRRSHDLVAQHGLSLGATTVHRREPQPPSHAFRQPVDRHHL
jgi:hypothetical protein